MQASSPDRTRTTGPMRGSAFQENLKQDSKPYTPSRSHEEENDGEGVVRIYPVNTPAIPLRIFFEEVARVDDLLIDYKTETAFVKFDTLKDAQRVIRKLDQCRLKGERVSIQMYPIPFSQIICKYITTPKPRPFGCHTIFVDYVSLEATSVEVRDFFEQCGKVKKVFKYKEKKGELPRRGCWFVEFYTSGATERAGERKNGAMFFGERVRVDFYGNESIKKTKAKSKSSGDHKDSPRGSSSPRIQDINDVPQESPRDQNTSHEQPLQFNPPQPIQSQASAFPANELVFSLIMNQLQQKQLANAIAPQPNVTGQLEILALLQRIQTAQAFLNNLNANGLHSGVQPIERATAIIPPPITNPENLPLVSKRIPGSPFIYASNIPCHVTEYMFRQHLSTCGTVLAVEWEAEANQNRAIAEFKTELEAYKFVSLYHARSLEGFPLRVDYAAAGRSYHDTY